MYFFLKKKLIHWK